MAPDSILWTDDLVFAEYAKSEVGVQRVWTQALVEHLVNRGLIDRAVAEEAYAKLLGFNYQSTHFRGMTMVAALRVSHGSIDAFPMRQIIQAFAPLAASPMAADRKNAFLMLAEFVLKLSLEPFLPETKCVATKALLELQVISREEFIVCFSILPTPTSARISWESHLRWRRT